MLADTDVEHGGIAAVQIPNMEEPFSLGLPPEILVLRDKALALHQQRGPVPLPLPEISLIDASSWRTHSEDEDWLIWRARRCAERLRHIPLDIESGERIVGKPRLRDPLPAEEERLEQARAVLASMPAYPGGDCGHFHPDFEKLFHVGLGGISEEIETRQRETSADAGKRTFYEACGIALKGMSAYVERVGDACEEMAPRAGEASSSWPELASICRRVAWEPPATFHEAIQLMFMAQVALWFGEDHGLTSPGRLDRTLRRFYEADIATERITRREAFELICCLYINLNRILHTGSAVAVMVGGRDRMGQTVANELTYLCLAARLATKLVYPTVALAWHDDLPPDLMDFSVQMLTTGSGDPAFFNDDLIGEGLREHGVSEEDSHDYMNSTCVEIKVVGRSNMWVTAPYFNCPQSLLETMEGVMKGELPVPGTLRALTELVRENLARKVAQAAFHLDQVWRDRAEHGCFPLASCFILDCLEKGLDFDRGGARYNWVENSFVGLANLVDSLLAIHHLVYEKEELSLAQFYTVLQDDFEGHEALRQRILNTLPKYGNDRDLPDQLALEWASFLIETTESNTVGHHRYVPGFFCWVMHERMGSETGATPDGRRAFWPLADGAGAAQGREKRGPTASVLSTTKWYHRRAIGGLVHNAKFSKKLLETEENRQALRNLIETYLRRGGFEIQINVVGKETLLAAREDPEQYPDLLVRVAGYSDYFVTLPANMQEEIIARTEHTL